MKHKIELDMDRRCKSTLIEKLVLQHSYILHPQEDTEK